MNHNHLTKIMFNCWFMLNYLTGIFIHLYIIHTSYLNFVSKIKLPVSWNQFKSCRTFIFLLAFLKVTYQHIINTIRFKINNHKSIWTQLMNWLTARKWWLMSLRLKQWFLISPEIINLPPDYLWKKIT